MQNNSARGNPMFTGSRRGPKRAAGLGSIELIMTVVMVSFIIGLASPVYQDAVEKKRIVVALEQIANFVGAVQSESIKLSKKVAVSYASQPGGCWCFGATLGNKPCDCNVTDPSSPGYCAIDSTVLQLCESDIRAAGSMNEFSGDGSFTFDPVRGILVDSTDSLVVGLQAGQGDFQARLHLLATGRISLCQQSVNDTGERIKSCSPVSMQY